jgi:hypothetical protein
LVKNRKVSLYGIKGENKMTRKGFTMLVLSVFAAGRVFAQTDFATMAKNTIVVDAGPAIVGTAIGVIGDMPITGGNISSSGFGFAAQYERQIFQKFSVAGRFAYLRGDIGIVQEEQGPLGTVRAELGMSVASYSIEGHARCYPLGRAFFLDGMLGYTKMTADFSGEMIATEKHTGMKVKESAELNASQDFLKFGVNVGWRISFGKNGGFVFEPAFGYSAGIGFGDTISPQLSKKMGADVNMSDFDKIFGYAEDLIFIGGPRLSLAFGYRF